MIRSIRPLASTLLLTLTMSLTSHAAPAAPPAGLGPDDWKQLSLREKIGQTVIISTDAARERQLGGGTLKGFLDKYPVSGVFLGSWKFEQVDANLKTNTIRQLVQEYRAGSKIPLFIQEDYEQGPGSANEEFTFLPNLMALGAANSPELAGEFGRILAQETRALGLNWLLNPVADLNRNFMNPVTNTRSVSDDPERAVRLLSRQVAAMQGHGLIATIKHFPGDGMDFRDQHLVTSVNSLGMDEWRASYGRVFQQLIREGVASVMIGHIALPAYQKERLNGRLLPASLSREIITQLLKGEMGFEGIVISDALNMGGLQSYYPTPVETQIQAFKAGTDLMLWPSLEYFDALEQRIRSGEIPMQRLDDAVRRVWAVKHRFGLLDGRANAPVAYEPAQRQAAQAMAQRIAQASITLVRDTPAMLPLKSAAARKLLLVIVAPNSLTEARRKTFAPTVAALQARGFTVDVRSNLSYYEHDLAKFDGYDRILFAFDRHTHAPMGTMQLYETEALTAWSANALPRAKVISVSYGDPYVHDVLLPLAGTAINVYSDSPVSQQALVQALTGEIAFQGQSPVSLEAVRRALSP